METYLDRGTPIPRRKDVPRGKGTEYATTWRIFEALSSCSAKELLTCQVYIVENRSTNTVNGDISARLKFHGSGLNQYFRGALFPRSETLFGP